MVIGIWVLAIDWEPAPRSYALYTLTIHAAQAIYRRGMSNRINSVFTLEDTLLAYAVGDSGLALASADGGATWRRLALPHRGNLYTVSFPGQGAIGYACGDAGAVLKTEDSGRT